MIIAIHGKAGHGKDTVAEFISSVFAEQFIKVENHKIKRDFTEPFEIIKFAAKVKETCALITGYPIASFYDRTKYNTEVPYLNMNLRELMQKVGGGLRNIINQDIWIRATLNKVRPHQNRIITDLRYINELKAIKQLGGLVIKVIRPEYNDNTIQGEQAKHPSEIELDNYTEWNGIIINDGDLDILKIKTIEFLKEQELI